MLIELQANELDVRERHLAILMADSAAVKEVCQAKLSIKRKSLDQIRSITRGRVKASNKRCEVLLKEASIIGRVV